jgi:hypothetical protein
MAIRSRSVNPATITNASGQPEIVLEINGMTLSMKPPPADDPQPIAAPVDDGENDEHPG